MILAACGGEPAREAPPREDVPIVIEASGAKPAKAEAVPPPVVDAAWAGAPPEGFVDLRAAIPDVCFDVRYATDRNFTGAVLPGYEVAGAWLRTDAAGALARAHAELHDEGLGLLVYDAYRPARASTAMVAWARSEGRADLVTDGYIAESSTHAKGGTVDVGLCDLATRDAKNMGTDFDAFIPAAHHGAVQGPPAALRERLRTAMTNAGFTAYSREWWHYAHAVPKDTVALDVPYAGAASNLDR